MYFPRKVYVVFLSSLQGNLQGTVAAYIVLPRGFLFKCLASVKRNIWKCDVGNVLPHSPFFPDLVFKHVAELCSSAALSGYID